MSDTNIYRPVRTGKGVLSDQVAHQILDLITSKQLEVGTRLPPLEVLTKYLAVSRTAVREAIKTLDAWGAVTIKHGVGTFVAATADDVLTIPLRMTADRSAEAIRHLHELREALEPSIAALAATNAHPEHTRQMEEAISRMDNASSDAQEYAEADLQFHSALAEATGNDLILIVIHPVIGLLQEARRLAIQSPGAGERAQVHHRIILDHVKSGRAEQARQAMVAHLNQTWQEIKKESEEYRLPKDTKP